MKNDFGGLLVGGGEPIYVKLKEVEKLAVRHFNVPNVQYLCNARTVLVPYNCAQLDPKCKQREKSERGLDESL